MAIESPNNIEAALGGDVVEAGIGQVVAIGIVAILLGVLAYGIVRTFLFPSGLDKKKD